MSVRREAPQQIGRLPYLPGLDGLRAIAVVAVMIYHANHEWHYVTGAENCHFHQSHAENSEEHIEGPSVASVLSWTVQAS